MVTAENVNLENIPVAGDSQNLEDKIEGTEHGQAPMEIDVVVDEVIENEAEKAEMVTSLNLNLSSISDAIRKAIMTMGRRKNSTFL